MRSADLAGADLDEADLSGADLRDAQLMGARARKARFAATLSAMSGSDAHTGRGFSARTISARNIVRISREQPDLRVATPRQCKRRWRAWSAAREACTLQKVGREMTRGTADE